MTNRKPKSGRSRRKNKNKNNSGEEAGAVQPTQAPKSKSKQKSKSSDKSDKAEQKKLTFGELQMLQQTVLNFLRSDDVSQEIVGLGNQERKEIHLFARQHGLKTRSRSNNGERVLTLSRGTNTKLNMRLDDIKLAVSLQFGSVLDMALKDLSRRRSQPIQPQRREQTVQNGGLVGIPRVPPIPRSTCSELDDERRNLPIFTKRERIFELLEMSQVCRFFHRI